MGFRLQMFKGFMRIAFALGIVLIILSIIKETNNYWSGLVASALTASGAICGWFDFDKLD